jgi:peptide/nickel transport system permease protein
MMNPGRMPSPEQIERLNRLYGLDKPWYEAYFLWLGNVVRGDLGRSIPQNNKRVAQLIVERMPATLMLSVTSLVLTYLVDPGLWIAVRAARFGNER